MIAPTLHSLIFPQAPADLIGAALAGLVLIFACQWLSRLVTAMKVVVPMLSHPYHCEFAKFSTRFSSLA